MISDLRAVDHDAGVAADVAIVGAGAAGLTLATALADSGLAVCLVESGGLEVEDAAQALCEGVSVGHPVSLTAARRRALGGATTAWTGRCARLDPEDFHARDWVPRSGWPISYETLEPYYRRAERQCGFTAPWTDRLDAMARRPQLSPPPLDDALIRPFVWRYPPPRNGSALDWGRRFRQSLRAAPNVRALMHATVTGFEISESGERLGALRVQAIEGAGARVVARAFVLCCGGIGNAQLLLDAARSTGARLGGDQVGRFFQQHSRGVIATLDADESQSARLQRTFNIFRAAQGHDHEIGMALSHAAQRRDGLLNASAILIYHADPDSGWESAKAAWRRLRGGCASGDLLAKLRHVAADADDVTANVLARVRAGRVILKTRRIDVVIDLEQAPDPDSRITLSDKRDAFGRPLPRVDWRLSELERRTSERFAAHIKAELERLGLAKARLEDWLASAAPMAEAPLAETYHHIASTRMSESPADGVADRDCKVHGVDNLYVAGSSSFATGGHANPTFTIVALALRLADHLRARLTASPAERLVRGAAHARARGG